MQVGNVKLRLLGLCERSVGGKLVVDGWRGWSPEGAARAALVKKRLRQLCWEVPRVLNRVMGTYVEHYRPFTADSEAYRAALRETPARSLGYRVARDVLQRIHDWKSRDGGKEEEPPAPWGVTSNVYNAVSDLAARAWANNVAEARLAQSRLPTFSAPHPIPIRDRGVELLRVPLLEGRGGKRSGEPRRLVETAGYVLSASVFAEEDPLLLHVAGTGPGTYAVLERIASGSYSCASARIGYDRSGWFVDLAYVWERIEGVAKRSGSGWVFQRSSVAPVAKEERRGRKSDDTGETEFVLEGAVDGLCDGEAYEIAGAWRHAWVSPDGREVPTRSFESTARALLGRAGKNGGVGAGSTDGSTDLCSSKLIERGWRKCSAFRVAYHVRKVRVLPQGRSAERLDAFGGAVEAARHPGREPVRVVGTATAAAVLGLYNWVYIVSSDGSSASWPGEPILHRIHGHHAVARRLRQELQYQGECHRGRGRRRFRRKLLEHADRWGRYTESVSRQLASRMIRWCARHGVGTLVLPKLVGLRDKVERKALDESTPDRLRAMIHNWPYHKLLRWIKADADRYGVVVVEHQAHGIARVCPKCLGERMPDGKRLFVCSHCDLVRDVDAVEAANLLIDAAAEESVSPKVLENFRFYGGRRKARSYWFLPPGALREYRARREALARLRSEVRAKARSESRAAAEHRNRAFKLKEEAERITDEMRMLRRSVEGGA